MEELSKYRLGAILATDGAGVPTGVISKTDIILAYRRKKDPLAERAESVMSTPIHSCGEEDLVEDAIRTMIYSDIHRLFVKNSETGALQGVFSLSDAARNRSGSCLACLSSRITIQPDQS
jgi:CBS domain-containing protein